MKKISVYHHPNCSTCKKALKFLESKKIEASLIDLREKAPSPKEIGYMLSIYKDQPKRVFNTSGQAYRTANLKDVINDLTPTQMKTTLAKDGLLIKRPFVLLSSKKGVVGFKEDEWKKLFL